MKRTDSIKFEVSMLRMPSERFAKIKIIAANEGRSTNGQISYIVQRCIDQYERENGTIKIDED